MLNFNLKDIVLTLLNDDDVKKALKVALYEELSLEIEKKDVQEKVEKNLEKNIVEEELIENYKKKEEELNLYKGKYEDILNKYNNEINELNNMCKKKDEEICRESKRVEEVNISLEQYKVVINKLHNEKNILNNDLDNLRNLIEEKNMELNSSGKEIKNLTKKIEELEVFNGFNDIYNSYQKLSDQSKRSLKGIFKGDDILRFICCGLQENNIENLWEYIKSEILNDRINDLENLEYIFSNFFDFYNLIYEKPVYIRQIVENNNEFDDEYYTRTSNSKPSGKIEEVLFKGYINSNNKKIVKKSIVRI